uniref:Uncharacterized protein n=1 Tax=Callorhinchus milii TaxID=7868 RepID=A0A4W3I5V8_CALMI
MGMTKREEKKNLHPLQLHFKINIADGCLKILWHYSKKGFLPVSWATILQIGRSFITSQSASQNIL